MLVSDRTMNLANRTTVVLILVLVDVGLGHRNGKFYTNWTGS